MLDEELTLPRIRIDQPSSTLPCVVDELCRSCPSRPLARRWGGGRGKQHGRHLNSSRNAYRTQNDMTANLSKKYRIPEAEEHFQIKWPNYYFWRQNLGWDQATTTPHVGASHASLVGAGCEIIKILQRHVWHLCFINWGKSVRLLDIVILITLKGDGFVYWYNLMFSKSQEFTKAE